MNLEQFVCISKEKISSNNDLIKQYNEKFHDLQILFDEKFEQTKCLNQLDAVLQQKNELNGMQERLQVSKITANQKAKRSRSRKEKFDEKIQVLMNRVGSENSKKTQKLLNKEKIKYFILTRITGLHLVASKSSHILKGGVVNVKNCSIRCFEFDLRNAPKESITNQIYELMELQNSENDTTWKELFSGP